MEIIREPLHDAPAGQEKIALRADRHTLAKRRWRGVAEDGREFGFDLEEPLSDCDAIFRDGGKLYVVFQEPEPLIEVILDEDSAKAAETGWSIGNMHLPMEVKGSAIRMAAGSVRR